MPFWSWGRICVVLCLYGCLKEIRPATHFLTQYLQGPWLNLTDTQVYNQVYPVWTYSYLCCLIIILLLTDYLRYKPVILLEAISYVVTWILLLWTEGLVAMQLMQLTFGVATASEVAYYTYIYAKVSPDKYRKVTSFIRAASLLGKVLSAVIAQVFVSTRLLDYHSLNYVSLAAVMASTVIAATLPTVKHGMYFNTSDEKDGAELKDMKRFSVLATDELCPGHPSALPLAEAETLLEVGKANFLPSEVRFEGYHLANGHSYPTPREVEVRYEKNRSKGKGCSRTIFSNIWRDLQASYSDPFIFKWSIWWVLGTSGSLQVGNYIQALWEEIYSAKEHQDIYNGAVDAIKTFLGAVVALGLGYVHLDWNVYGEVTLGFVSFVDAALLFVMAYSQDIWVTYSMFCIFRASYQMLITISSYQVAKEMKQNTYALVFGCNTFFALVVQTFLTAIVVDEVGLGLSPSEQFVVYGGYFVIVGLIFTTMAIRVMILKYISKNNKNPSELEK